MVEAFGSCLEVSGRSAAVGKSNVDGFIRANARHIRILLVGGEWLPWMDYFPILIGVAFIIPIDELIFFRGVAQPPTRLGFRRCVLAHPKNFSGRFVGADMNQGVSQRTMGRNLTCQGGSPCDERCLKWSQVFCVGPREWLCSQYRGFWRQLHIHSMISSMYMNSSNDRVVSTKIFWNILYKRKKNTRPPSHQSHYELAVREKIVVILPFKSRAKHPHFLVFAKTSTGKVLEISLKSKSSDFKTHIPRSSVIFDLRCIKKSHPQLPMSFSEKKQLADWQMRKVIGWWPGKKLARQGTLVTLLLIQKVEWKCCRWFYQ